MAKAIRFADLKACNIGSDILLIARPEKQCSPA